MEFLAQPLIVTGLTPGLGFEQSFSAQDLAEPLASFDESASSAVVREAMEAEDRSTFSQGLAIAAGFRASAFRSTATIITLLFMGGFAIGRLASIITQSTVGVDNMLRVEMSDPAVGRLVVQAARLEQHEDATLTTRF